MRRAERLAPRRVGDQRHQRAMRAARRRTRDPVVLAGRVHRIVHEAVRAGRDARPAIVGRAVEPHRGAERPARHFERADQAGQQRARPAAFVAAPAVVHGLAERDRDRPQRQGLALDLDRLADAGVVEELVGDAADGPRLDVADRHPPIPANRPARDRRGASNAGPGRHGAMAGDQSSSGPISMPSTVNTPSSAGSMPCVSNGTARPVVASTTSGLRGVGSRRK